MMMAPEAANIPPTKQTEMLASATEPVRATGAGCAAKSSAGGVRCLFLVADGPDIIGYCGEIGLG